MIVSDKHRYVYIAIPRTASKSIARWLAAHYDGHVVGKHHSTDVPQRCKDYLVWTVVRNPYERAVSGYFAAHKASRQPAPVVSRSLEDYLLFGKLRPQTEAIWQAGVQLMLYYEHLPFCLAELPFTGEVFASPERVDERGDRPVRDFFELFGTAEELAWTWAKADFEAMGYARHNSTEPSHGDLCRWIEK